MAPNEVQQSRYMLIVCAITNQTGGVPPGLAVPPAVADNECVGAHLAQASTAASPDATAATQLTDESGSEHVDGQRRPYIHAC